MAALKGKALIAYLIVCVFWGSTYLAIKVGVTELPPFLFALMVGIAYTVEWIKERWQKTPFLRAWYIQPFNVAAHLLAGAATRWIYNTLDFNTAPVLSPLPVSTTWCLLAAQRNRCTCWCRGTGTMYLSGSKMRRTYGACRRTTKSWH